MSKKDFLKKLSRELNGLPAAERKKTIDYYSELIDDRIETGATEESAVLAMGEIKDIANEIKNDARERGVVIKKRHSALFWGLLSALLIILGIAAIGGLVYAVLTRVFNADIGKPIEWVEQVREYDIADEDGITIDISDLDLYIGPSEDSLVHVTYYESDTIKFVISRENGLTIRQQGKLTLIGQLIGSNRRQVKVLVPESFRGKLKSDLTTGETRVDHVSPATLDISATTGVAVIEDSNAKVGDLSVTTGQLKVINCGFEEHLKASGSTGEISLDRITCGSLEVHATTGAISLKNITSGDIEAKLTTGRIDADSITAESITLESTTGEIDFRSLEASYIGLFATTGDIRGVLVGNINDYTVESSSSTGSNSLPTNFGTGAKRVKVRTSTGDIKVTFSSND